MTVDGGIKSTDLERARALVVNAAQRAFAEHGTAVSVEQIARVAGVGPEAVQRHFPAKANLLEAVLLQRIEQLTGRANHYRGAADAGVAFFDFCAEVLAAEPGNRAPCDLLDSQDGWPQNRLGDARTRFRGALDQLLVAAQHQGVVRADITLIDVLAIFAGCTTIQRMSEQDGSIAHTAQIVLDALRTAPCAAGVPSSDSTRIFAEQNRQPTAGDPSRCRVCAVSLAQSGAGRPARYCSAACRQKAHRRRARASAS